MKKVFWTVVSVLCLFLLTIVANSTISEHNQRLPYTYQDSDLAPILLSESSRAVKEGDITKEFYDEMKVFYSKFKSYNSALLSASSDYMLDKDVVNKKEYRESLNKILDKGAIIMEGYSLSPSNRNEKEIDDAFIKLINVSKDRNSLFYEILETYGDTSDSYRNIRDTKKAIEELDEILARLNK